MTGRICLPPKMKVENANSGSSTIFTASLPYEIVIKYAKKIDFLRSHDIHKQTYVFLSLPTFSMYFFPLFQCFPNPNYGGGSGGGARVDHSATSAFPIVCVYPSARSLEDDDLAEQQSEVVSQASEEQQQPQVGVRTYTTVSGPCVTRCCTRTVWRCTSPTRCAPAPMLIEQSSVL